MSIHNKTFKPLSDSQRYYLNLLFVDSQQYSSRSLFVDSQWFLFLSLCLIHNSTFKPIVRFTTILNHLYTCTSITICIIYRKLQCWNICSTDVLAYVSLRDLECFKPTYSPLDCMPHCEAFLGHYHITTVLFESISFCSVHKVI